MSSKQYYNWAANVGVLYTTIARNSMYSICFSLSLMKHNIVCKFYYIHVRDAWKNVCFLCTLFVGSIALRVRTNKTVLQSEMQKTVWSNRRLYSRYGLSFIKGSYNCKIFNSVMTGMYVMCVRVHFPALNWSRE